MLETVKTGSRRNFLPSMLLRSRTGLRKIGARIINFGDAVKL
jgi:hypothetical protein